VAGDLTRRDLDLISPGHKLRVQHQTGSLWILNSLALEAVDAEREGQRFIERDAGGALTGRIWRGDAWLRSRLPGDIPPLAPVGRQLAAFGITAVTDTSATTDETAAGFLADAVRRGDLPQRLTVMSRANLAAPDDGAFALGPVKILLDDHDLPDLEAFIAAIRTARVWRRAVAVHCVTATQLALTLAAFKTAGSVTGDRIEHGSIIPAAAIAALRALRLTIVTQPGFVRERGDRYAIDVDPAEQGDLYRCRTLIEAGINLAAGSDAPYASPDPWTAIEAATTRCTKTGRVLGQDERLAPRSALALYLKEPASAASLPRTISVGARAELCLLATPLAQMLAHPAAELVRATFAGGRLIYSQD
jgi:predicted amidohydrolase YtcJ